MDLSGEMDNFLFGSGQTNEIKNMKISNTR